MKKKKHFTHNAFVCQLSLSYQDISSADVKSAPISARFIIFVQTHESRVLFIYQLLCGHCGVTSP